MEYLWQRKNWFDLAYREDAILAPLGKLRLLQGKLLERVTALDLKLETEAEAAVLTEEAVRTAEIEGHALDRNAVRSSVAARLGLPRGVGVHSRHADGLVDVLLDAARHYDKPLTMARLNGWQASLFPGGYSGLRKIRVGKLRGNDPMQIVSGPLGKEKIHFEAPPVKQLEREMPQFLEWWRSSAGRMDGVLRAGAAHLIFVTLHPYEDGNGRLARALTDMALAQDEKLKVRYYSVSSEIMRRREEYYTVLEDVQRCRLDATQWFLWFLRCVTASIEHSHEIVGAVFLRVAFWKQHGRTALTGRQRKVVGKLVDAGPGNFTGGLTTRKYVALAGVSRATAFREIADLVGKGILRQLPGKGRSVHYDIVWPPLPSGI